MEDALTLTQKIYIAYYGRPADPAGLSYWANRIDSEGLEAVIEAFASSPESVALYGAETGEAETAELVTAVYQQLFSREPDAAGLAFYTDRITSGEFTAATAMLDILNGARDTDLQVADNKLTVAQDFTDQVTDQDLAYSGEAAAGVGRLLLDQVSASPVQELETVTQLAVEVADLASTQTELVAELIPTGGEVGDLLESLPPEADAEDLLTLIEAVVTSALDDPSVLSSLIEAGGGSFASTLEALDDAGSLTEILNEADAGGATALEALLNDSTGGGTFPTPPPTPPDTTAPTIDSVNVTDGTHKIGDTVVVTVTAGPDTESNPETGLTLSGSFNGRELSAITDNDDGTYTGTYTVTAGDADVADSGMVVTDIVLTDAAGNASDPFDEVTLSGESIDANAPSIESVSVANGTHGIGDTVAVTVTAGSTAGSAETGLTLSGTFNGRELSAMTDNGDGTYTGTYTVTAGDADVADSGMVVTDIVLTDAAGNASPAHTEVTLAGESIDATAPTIDSVSVASGTHKIGDTVRVTVTAGGGGTSTGGGTGGGTVGSAETDLTLTGTFNGQALSAIADNGDGTYTGTYTVTAGDADVADSGMVVTDIVLTDAAGNASPAHTAVTLAGESIDANAPSIESVSVASGTHKIGDTVAVTVTAGSTAGSAETDLTLSGTFNGQELSAITDNGDGTYTGTYTVTAGDDDVADAGTVVTDIVLTDAAGNASDPFAEVTLAAGESIDATAPILSSSSPADDAVDVAPNSTISLTFDSAIKLGSSGSITLVNAADSGDNRTINVGTDNGQQLSINTDGDSTVLTINPTNDLASNNAYHLEIEATAITDLAGNAYAGISTPTVLNFGTGVPDTTPPSIESVSVANGAYQLGDTVAVTVTAGNDTAGNPETGLTLSGTFNGRELSAITDNGNGTYTGTYTVSAGDDDVADTETVTTALVLTDAAGNASPAHTAVTLAGESITATTSTVVFDLIAGLSSNHSDRAFVDDVTYSIYIRVDSNSQTITLADDEDWADADNLGTDDQVILVGNGSIPRFAVNNPLDQTDDTRVRWITQNGNPIVSLRSHGDLIRNYIPSGSTVDLWGGTYTANPMALAPLADLPSGVSLPDRVAPTLSSSSPADNATDVALNNNLSLTFDSAIKLGSGIITLANDDNASDSRVINVRAHNGQLSINTDGDSTVLTINPTDNLASNNAYHLEIAATAITDLAGNAYAGISDGETLNFDTGAEADTTAPSIESVSVADGSYQLGDTVQVTVTADNDTAGNPETGLTLSGTFNGQALSDTTDNRNGTYTGTYTVSAGDDDVADTETVTTALVLTDAAGNASPAHTAVTLAGESITASASTVVFDLIAGLSSNHSDRAFVDDVTYSIYIRVDSNSHTITLADDEGWADANNLGTDDQVILVGNGSIPRYDVDEAYNYTLDRNNRLLWVSISENLIARLADGGVFTRGYDARLSDVDLWAGSLTIDLMVPTPLADLPSGVDLPMLP